MLVSGVTGSGGAMTTMFAELVLLVLGVLLLKTGAGGMRNFILFLGWAGVIGTLFAASLLHGWWTVVALLVYAVGVVIETFGPKPTRSAL